MLDRKLIILMLIPVVSIITASFAAAFVKLKPALNPDEARLLTFSPETINIVERVPVSVTKALKSPIEITYRDFPPLPLEAMVKKQSVPSTEATEVKVSFILINGGRKIAIVNGFVLREGDNFDSNKVVMIERDRVLIKEGEKKEEKWVMID